MINKEQEMERFNKNVHFNKEGLPYTRNHIQPVLVYIHKIDNHLEKATAIQVDLEHFVSQIPSWWYRDHGDISEHFVNRISRTLDAIANAHMDRTKKYKAEDYYEMYWGVNEKEVPYRRKVNSEGDIDLNRVKGDLSEIVVKLLREKYPGVFKEIYKVTKNEKLAYSDRWDKKSIIIYRGVANFMYGV